MKIKKTFRSITKHYKGLVKITKKHYFIGITNEWVVDNYYLVVEQIKKIMYVWRIWGIRKYMKKNIDMVKIISDILDKYNYKVTEEIIIKEMNNFQKKNDYNLLYEEIFLIPTVISIVFLNKINEICKIEQAKMKDRKRVNKIIERLKMSTLYKDKTKLNDYFNINKESNTSIVYFNEQLKDLGKLSSNIFKQFNESLKENNMSLRKIIYDEHIKNTASSITISNVFTSILNLKNEALYKNISNVEKALKKDPYYVKATLETKALYRNQIVSNSKKKNVDPVDYVEGLLDKSEDVSSIIFKKKKNNLKSIFYIILVLIMSFVLTYYLSSIFITNIILGFLILIIPVSEIVVTFVNKFILKFVESRPLPKLDFSKGIPKDCQTMVVIPTILKDKEKVVSVFESLESYYLSNKLNNLYFSLLGDCKEHDNEFYEKDEEIITAGCDKARELNEKYGKEIFFFAYRKRMYNEGEGTWLGYERKRGGLIHFNDLILGNLSKEEINKFFRVQTLTGFKEKIKYVITLDVDTKLVLNSAQRLIGTMAHPFNRPILNEEGTCVISGYAIMQPKIATDINSTNRSLFSQLYDGTGGFDPYSSLHPHFYQDVFGEGVFIGKGIYDIDVYQQVLKTRFPENIILSHDLVESNFLRCANVLDVDLIDDFPSKYLVDASRRSRWARGDMQIIDWATPKVRDLEGNIVKNPINILGRMKIIDNIRRGLIEFNLLLIIIAAISMSIYNPIWWILLALFISMLPVISHIINELRLTNVSLRYYNSMAFGNRAFFLRTLSVFSTIPFNAKLYITSFSKSLYRMFISKKKLLNWMTAEDAEKLINNGIISTIKQFWINYAISILIIGISLLYKTNMTLSIVISLIFMFGPIYAYLISKDIIFRDRKKELNNNDKEYLYNLACKTWEFFRDNLNEENHYLIPDNHQLNKDIKDDIKTSPTNIGMSLISIISACEMDIIDEDEAIRLLTKIIKTVDKLPKWNGHLYNWYNIHTLEIMYPHFISTVDTGNFTACLIVLKEFLRKKEYVKLENQVQLLIDKTDFKVLYNDTQDVFSVGYNVIEGRLEPFNYNKFISESRLAGYIAIGKGEIPSRHWFNLDKTLGLYKKKKGVISWSGTAFEYFMPLMFMKSYPNTLLDESYHFAYYTQRKFIREVGNYPWGISESAYNELDDANNYKYKAFGIPYLKLKQEPMSRVVIAPYGSILAIMEFPKEVVNNIRMYEPLGMMGKYGLYESYDITDKKPVMTYYSHHQGMIIGSIANCLKDGVLQNYFNSDVNNKAFEILTKEKVQIKPAIDLKITKYKKYVYEKEYFENDVRIFRYISTLPEFSALSNSKYTMLINDRGNGFSRYRTIQLNRYRKISEQDYGMFLYVKDLTNNKIWSNTYAPMNVKPDRYEVVFSLDNVKFVRVDDEIITTTEIVVTTTHNAEIRKVTFKNNSDKVRILELTTYTEPILCENMADVSSRVFNGLFVNSEFEEETNSIIMHRKLRDSKLYYYMINRLLIDEPLGNYEYETNRDAFIGHNRSGRNPIALEEKLSNYAGTNLEPIISLRNKIKLPPNDKKTVYIINGFGKSREQVMDIVRTFSDKQSIKEGAFAVTTIMSNVTNKMINITGGDMRLYNTMINYLYQTAHISINEERRELQMSNKLGQSSLWRFGVSGDLPMILLEVYDLNHLSLVKELLHAFEYYKSKSIFVDLIIINCEGEEEASIIAKEIEDEKYHMYAINSFHKIPGNIKLIERKDISEEELNLLRMVTRLRIDSSLHISLQDYIGKLQRMNTMGHIEKDLNRDSLPITYDPKKVSFNNTYGGFINNGKNYLIVNKNTPTVWSNVIANENFGTIITNNNCGFTYAINSREYKLTSWTNDTVLTDRSENIKINDYNLNYDLVNVGYGYSEFKGIMKNLDITLTQFVAAYDPVKFYKIKIKNESARKQRVVLKYWINPCLGVTEEKTARHILCNYNKEENYLRLRNVYSEEFSDQYVFMSSTLPIESARIGSILFKSIETSFYIDAHSESEMCFMLGSCDEENVDVLSSKYSDIEVVNQEFDNVVNKWDNNLSKVRVNTPSKSFNYMMNGWLLYQTLVSRLYAKAGYHQVGGAFGYRDQLQDAMNITSVHPEITRKQILWNAKHQFETGDVLHWWHKELSFGLRSLYKDDYLWLVYATHEYINITEDYSILDEKVPFVSGDSLHNGEAEKGIKYSYTNKTATLYNHCKLAIEKSMKELGENGLPLMGGGDWNDGMNHIGVKGKGTSVWLGFFLYLQIQKFVDVTNRYDSKINVNKYVEFNKKLKKSLRDVAWDGNYYLRAFFDNGEKLGSSSNKECQIDLLSQSFAILSEVATKEQIPLIMNAVDEKLVDNKTKIVKLLTPAFKDNENNPGYIMDYPVGIRENGGQYTHSVSWYIMALIKLGMNDKAFDVFQMINPIRRTLTKNLVNKYKVEPYVIAADIYSNENYPGRGGWTWYTGSSGWFYKIGLVDILGFNKRGEKLYIKPNIPSGWKEYSLDYKYNDSLYKITVINNGENGIIVDDKKVRCDYITLKDDKKIHKIIVYIGGKND